MVTSLDLYWLLKLDDVRALLWVMTFMGFVLLTVLTPITVGYYDLDKDERPTKLLLVIPWVLSIAFLLCGPARTFIPSTKQAAIIYGAPALLNSKAMQEDLPKEARELYSLGKQWLHEQAKNAEEDTQ